MKTETDLLIEKLSKMEKFYRFRTLYHWCSLAVITVEQFTEIVQRYNEWKPE